MDSREDTRQATLAGFSALSMGVSPWVYSVGAIRDAERVLMAIQEDRELGPDMLATREDRYHTASMRIMQSICRAINNGEGERPVIWNEVDGVDDLYAQASEFLTSIDLDFDLRERVALMGRIAQTCINNKPAGCPQEQFAKDIWYNRGTVAERRVGLRDIVTAQTEGGRPEFNLALIPFYSQYISPTQGAYEYLQAYFEDTLALNEKVISSWDF
jgi:hypothetical protein